MNFLISEFSKGLSVQLATQILKKKRLRKIIN